MKRIVIIAFVFSLISASYAQKGSPLLTHYTESREMENQNWAICQDADQVMIFANRKGLLTFDGQDWKSFRLPVIPYSMQYNPADNRVYIGSDNSFGYAEKGSPESFRYNSLSTDSLIAGIITKIIFRDSLVWFCGDRSVVRYNRITDKIELLLAANIGYPFTGVFVTPANTFINVAGKGLHRLEADTLFPIVTGYLTEQTEILFSLPYDRTRVLIGKGNGELSLFDGIKYYEYQLKDEGYIAANILSEGIVVGDSAYAFSTLDGGAVVVEKLSGKVLYTISNQSELPDDEVFAIASDISGGLWLSHQYGLTRADLNLPVENYTIFPGLRGNLTSALNYEGEMYVATSEGVFVLAEVRDYTEIEILVEDKSKRVSSDADQPEQQEQPATRRNIFSRIFGKRSLPEKASSAEPERPLPVKEPTYSKKKVSRLKSINYTYRKIPGLNEKCRQLVLTPYGILAATNQGLFIIRDKIAKPIIPGSYINYIGWTPSDGSWYVASDEGCFMLTYNSTGWIFSRINSQLNSPAYSVLYDRNNNIWIGGDNIAARVKIDQNAPSPEINKYLVDFEYPDRYQLRMINDTIFLFAGSGISYFNPSDNKFKQYNNIRSSVKSGQSYILPLSNRPLLMQDERWISLEAPSYMNSQVLSLLKVFEEIVYIGVEDNKILIIDRQNKLFSVDCSRLTKLTPLTDIIIKNITNSKGTSFNLRDVKLDRGDNVICFDIVAPSFLKQKTTQYQYSINRIMNDWSEWSVNNHYEKVIPRAGEYTLSVRARDIWGNIGEPETLRFTIRAPFFKTVPFYILSVLVSLSLVYLLIRFRERQLQEKNRLLEQKVRERTAEIEAQKEEITSSIEYAGRIQRAMLPVEQHFTELFSDHFIFFKPRDIVSGDFYWIGENEKSIFFTIADCTGHGVPGAFMSTMGISTLNEIVSNHDDLQANSVLNILKQKIIRALHQTGKEGEAADGMDIAFCVLNKNRKILQYSGAFNPLILFQEGEFKEYRADRMPIGIHYGDEKSFTNFVIPVSRGDTLYLFSDGFNDQFGGPESVKYKMSNFRILLKEIYNKPMAEQRTLIENEFNKWRGSLDQVDDITIIGIRI